MIQPGQYVAAYVPYTKRTKSWIMATIVRWADDQQMYIVEDCYPDKKKKVYQWPVQPDKAISFPSPMDEVYEIGDKVLSLWLEDNQWSSMFYDACVVEPAGPLDTHLRIQYSGSSKDVFTVCKDRLVKRLPSKSSRGKKEKRKREDGTEDGPSSKRPKSSDNSSDSDDSSEERKPGPKQLSELSPHLNGSGGARRTASPRNGTLANGTPYGSGGGGRRKTSNAALEDSALHLTDEAAMNPNECCLLRHASGGPIAKKMLKLIALYAERDRSTSTASSASPQMAT